MLIILYITCNEVNASKSRTCANKNVRIFTLLFSRFLGVITCFSLTFSQSNKLRFRSIENALPVMIVKLCNKRAANYLWRCRTQQEVEGPYVYMHSKFQVLSVVYIHSNAKRNKVIFKYPEK